METDWKSCSSTDMQKISEVNNKNFVNNKTSNLSNVTVNVSKDTVSAAGFDIRAPIVDALIGNIKGTLSTKKTDGGESIRCEICNCDISSNTILDFHIKGSRHTKKLKALEIIGQLKAAGEKGITLGNGVDPNSFRCEICSLTVNSPQQLEFHLSGTKHKKKVAKDNEPASNQNTDSNLESNLESNSNGDKNLQTDNSTLIKPHTNITATDNKDEGPGLPLPKKKKKEEPKMVICDICNISMNSQIQYDQHLASKKHNMKKSAALNHKKFGIGNINKQKFIKSSGNEHFNSKFSSNQPFEVSMNNGRFTGNRTLTFPNYNTNNYFNETPFMNERNNDNSNRYFKNNRFHSNNNNNNFQKRNFTQKDNYNTNNFRHFNQPDFTSEVSNKLVPMGWRFH